MLNDWVNSVQMEWKPQELRYNAANVHTVEIHDDEALMVSTGIAENGEPRALFVRFGLDADTGEWQPLSRLTCRLRLMVRLPRSLRQIVGARS